MKQANDTVATGAITAAQLTITNPVIASKAYDENTTATVTTGTLSGIVESEDVRVSAVAFYSYKITFILKIPSSTVKE